MKTHSTFSLSTLLYAALAHQSVYAAEASTIMLQPHDLVGMSFWFISMVLVASTVFFFLEMLRVSDKWKTSLILSGLVTLVASVHYFYMRDVWVLTQSAPTVFRYIDWLITVPLLIMEFYFILSAITRVPSGVMVRLLIGTLIMLIAGYIGEAGYAPVLPAYIVGMFGWLIILFELFIGEASNINASKAPASVRSAFNLMRLIVTFGWSIYPIGYYFGYLTNMDQVQSMQALNIIYNLADLVNKVTFGLIIWSVAIQATLEEKK